MVPLLYSPCIIFPYIKKRLSRSVSDTRFMDIKINHFSDKIFLSRLMNFKSILSVVQTTESRSSTILKTIEKNLVRLLYGWKIRSEWVSLLLFLCKLQIFGPKKRSYFAAAAACDSGTQCNLSVRSASFICP